MFTPLLSGDFVTRSRLVMWSAALIVATLVVAGYLVATAHGLNDYYGRPLGTDFSDVYAAGQLAREGLADKVYDPVTHHAKEQAIFGPETPFYGWHYPPFFLIVAEGLAHLPYLPALALWLALTFALYLAAMRALLKDGPSPELARDPVWILTTIAFPAVFVNLLHGQNGFLTAALMAGAIAFLDRRPLVAGILFGLMAYKPQFGVLIPLALAAGGKWKSFASATATVAALIAVATFAFGTSIWEAFATSGHFSRTVILEAGSTGFQKIQSVFAAVRLLGGSIPLAYALQAIAATAAAVLVVWLWRGKVSRAIKGAGLALATLFVTPYCLDYDLMLLAPVIAALAGEIHATKPRRGEVLILAALWLVPYFARSFGGETHVALAPLAIAAGLILVFRRARNAF